MSRLLLYRLKSYKYIPQKCICQLAHRTNKLVETISTDANYTKVCCYHRECVMRAIKNYHHYDPLYFYFYAVECIRIKAIDSLYDLIFCQRVRLVSKLSKKILDFVKPSFREYFYTYSRGLPDIHSTDWCKNTIETYPVMDVDTLDF